MSTSPSRPTTTRRTTAPLRWFLRLQIALYRRSGGRLGGHVGRTPVLLLTTTGRKSGQPHTVSLGYFETDGVRFVVASNSGSPHDPAWYLNLVSHPRVQVQVGPREYPALAAPATGEERARLWAYLMASAPAYRRYARSSREIPIVTLRPLPTPGASS